MIVPYVAVILDSFRAAMASRVLWVALVAIWMTLGILGLMGIREKYRTTFITGDFYNGTRMKGMLAQGLADPALAERALGRLAGALPPDLQRQLRRVADGDEVRIELSKFSDAFNRMLQEESWYSPESWSEVVRLRELRELEELPAGQLADGLRQRRARLRIEAALPGVFRSRSARSIVMTYAGVDFPTFLEVDKARFSLLVNQFVLPFLVSSLLGAALVFLGVLVTASVVPDMLQPGSLHLLLSKPISRPLLFLSKFVGGCAFVLLCVTQLVVGIWLLAGVRLGLWNARILWCIPACVFLFAVYYSVSVYAGLRWRSSILAIGVTCFFAAICFLVGFVGGIFDENVSGPNRIRRLVVDGPDIMAATEGGTVVQFDRRRNRWAQVSPGSRFDRVLGPVRLGDGTFVTANVPAGRRNPFGSGAVDLQRIRRIPDRTDQARAIRERIEMDQVIEGESTLLSQDWYTVANLRLPTATARLYRLGGDRLIAINGSGVFACDLDKLRSQPETGATDPATASKADSWLANLLSMQGASAENFWALLPDHVAVTAPTRVVAGSDGESILFASHGTLSLLRPSGNPERRDSRRPWKVIASHTFTRDASKPIVAAFGETVVAAARPDGPLRLFGLADLKPIAAVPLDAAVLSLHFIPAVPPRAAIPPTDNSAGRPAAFVVHDTDGRGRVIDLSGKTIEELPQRDIESLFYDVVGDSLYVAHRVDAIDRMNVATWTTEESIRPTLGTWRWADRYVLGPLRTLVPKTGELSGAVSNLVGGKSSFVIHQDEGGDGTVMRTRLLPPILSCAVFIVFMLSVSCWRFTRNDF